MEIIKLHRPWPQNLCKIQLHVGQYVTRQKIQNHNIILHCTIYFQTSPDLSWTLHVSANSLNPMQTSHWHFFWLALYSKIVYYPLTAKLFDLHFHPLEVVSRWRDPQLQVSENNSNLTTWRSTNLKYCWIISLFIFNWFKNWYVMW